MGMYQSFATDQKSEREGIWLDYGDFRVRVARAGGSNKKFQRLYEEKTRPHQRAIAVEALSDELSEKIMRELYADAVILAWETRATDDKADPTGDLTEGIESESGDIVPVTKENIIATFEKLPDLFRDIVNSSQKSALFSAALRGQAAGN